MICICNCYVMYCRICSLSKATVPMQYPFACPKVPTPVEKFDWDSSDCQLMNPLCAVLSLCWPTIGRGCGAFFGAHIWDFAGSWPIFLSAGLSLRSFQTGNEITQLDTVLFARESKDPWKLREYYILSSEKNFSSLKRRIIPKNQIKAR